MKYGIEIKAGKLTKMHDKTFGLESTARQVAGALVDVYQPSVENDVYYRLVTVDQGFEDWQ